ncbi:ATP-binding protein [candidate division KSB1 bacterium]|nr:ATP-binding protein [candidate division KSB1 bacterium]
MVRSREIFPFSAIVGQEAMKTALILNLIDPTIGGVLIRGQKGTGKSTAIRALPQILPSITVVRNCPYHCPPDNPERMHRECFARFQAGEKLPSHEQKIPLVELPLNATEDRVAGSLDIGKSLTRGEIQFQPGLLASANRGILYIDEVNLLDDHIVDLLLDTAASGVNMVEREGISYAHPSQFILIGTMNPEEGELRPQLLDRFAFCVEISGLEDEQNRREIIRRRIQFETNTATLVDQFSREEALLQGQIVKAQNHLANVQITEPLYERSVKIALALQVHGHRTDITLIKAARALAAFLEKPSASEDDLMEVAPLVLLHRIKKSPLDTYDKLKHKIQHTLETLLGAPPPHTLEDYPESEIKELDAESMQIPGSGAAGSILFDFLKKKN